MEQKMRKQSKTLFVTAQSSSEYFLFYYNFETSYFASFKSFPLQARSAQRVPGS